MLTMLQTKKLRLKFCEIPMDFSPKIKDKEHNLWNLCMYITSTMYMIHYYDHDK